MFRIASAALLVAACATTPRPIQNTNHTPQRYTLEPMQLHGGEGLHSMSQSWTTVKGSLVMQQLQATLTLDMTTQTSFIHCPEQMQGVSMQACAPPDSKDQESSHTIAMSGDAHHENGQLVITVRKDDLAATLTCAEQGSSLECAFDDDYTLFSRVGQRPGTVTFHL